MNKPSNWQHFFFRVHNVAQDAINTRAINPSFTKGRLVQASDVSLYCHRCNFNSGSSSDTCHVWPFSIRGIKYSAAVQIPALSSMKLKSLIHAQSAKQNSEE